MCDHPYLDTPYDEWTKFGNFVCRPNYFLNVFKKFLFWRQSHTLKISCSTLFWPHFSNFRSSCTAWVWPAWVINLVIRAQTVTAPYKLSGTQRNSGKSKYVLQIFPNIHPWIWNFFQDLHFISSILLLSFLQNWRNYVYTSTKLLQRLLSKRHNSSNISKNKDRFEFLWTLGSYFAFSSPITCLEWYKKRWLLSSF